MPNAGIISLPRDSQGKYPSAFEYVALGVLSKLASERGWRIGKPFEIADAQALLRHLEAALPSALKRQAEREAAIGTARIYLARLSSGNIECTTEGVGPGTPPRDVFQITEPEPRAFRDDLDVVLGSGSTARRTLLSATTVPSALRIKRHPPHPKPVGLPHIGDV